MRPLTSDITTATQSRKARLKSLAQQLSAMEATAARHTPIPVLRCRRCAHTECGRRLPKDIPTAALVIWLGCTHE